MAASLKLTGAFEQNATTLDLSGHGLTTLPPNIGELNHLQSLRLDGNALVALPSSIDRLLQRCSIEPAHILDLPKTPDGKASEHLAGHGPGRAAEYAASEPPRAKRRRLEAFAAQGVRGGDNAGARNERTALVPLREAFTSDRIVKDLLAGGQVNCGNVTAEISRHWTRHDVILVIDQGKASKEVRFQLSADRRHILPLRYFDPELLAPLVRSGLLRREIFISRESPVLSDAIRRTIVDDVTRRFSRCNFSRCLNALDLDGAMRTEHLILGILMDSLWTTAYGRDISNMRDAPPDCEIDRLLQDAVESLLQQPLSIWDRNALESLKYRTFEPGIKETFKVLDHEFENVPHLRNIAPEHRWRLLVDRSTVGILERLGMSSENPLLAFIFNTEPGYAELLARGWARALGATSMPVSADTSLRILSDTTGSALCKEGSMTFGATFTPGGILRIGENMRSIDAHGFPTFLQIGGKSFTQDRTFTCAPGGLYDRDLVDELDEMDADETLILEQREGEAGSVCDLLSNRTFEPLQFARFGRLEGDPATSPERLESAMNAFMAPVGQLLSRMNSMDGNSPDGDEIRRVIAGVYLQEETLHAMADGNYRLWGLLEKNRWYAMAGEGMSLVFSANLSDGSSVEEAAAMDKEGQQFVARMSKTYRNAATSGSFFDMSELHDLALNGPIETLHDKVAAARLYPMASPSKVNVRALLLGALNNGAPLAHQIILTDLPHFDAEEEPELLRAAARAGAKDFCAHLYSIGADPDALGSEAEIEPEILKLAQLARTIRKFADTLATVHGDTSMFMALRAHDTDELERLLTLPDCLHGYTEFQLFQEFLKDGEIFRGVGFYALRREEVLESALAFHKTGELKGLLSEYYPLHHLQSSVRLRLALLFLEELEIDSDSKLEILLAADEAGEGVLHKMVKDANDIGFRYILDSINALEIPAARKLEAVLARDKEGRSALDYLLGDSGARMARVAREWTDKLPASKESDDLKRKLASHLRQRTPGESAARVS